MRERRSNLTLDDENENSTDSCSTDIGGLQKRLASLKDELLFWRRSDRVSRQCLKALLQERLTVNQEELDGLPRPARQPDTRANSHTMIYDDSSQSSEPANISIVLDCLRLASPSNTKVNNRGRPKNANIFWSNNSTEA